MQVFSNVCLVFEESKMSDRIYDDDYNDNYNKHRKGDLIA